MTFCTWSHSRRRRHHPTITMMRMSKRTRPSRHSFFPNSRPKAARPTATLQLTPYPLILWWAVSNDSAVTELKLLKSWLRGATNEAPYGRTHSWNLARRILVAGRRPMATLQISAISNALSWAPSTRCSGAEINYEK
jgi:hypothetical protein